MRIMVVGGAGFIGCNTALRLMQRGEDVLVLDNLSRRGTEANLEWLQSQGNLDFVQCDIRDINQLNDVFKEYREVNVVIHLAAQVAVTTSVQDPREDFEINALGTFNLLEAVRRSPSDPLVIYASTNKVYGGMEDIVVEEGPGMVPDEKEGRYQYRDFKDGIPEDRLLDFHSPYGCSKGAADQYVRDYARIYGLRTAVFRQSCIYGPRQFGIEDQGWVAWFTISAVLGRKINIFGDGKQVRDMLHVDDLIDAYLFAIERRNEMTGRIFNVGGGPKFTRSILGLVHHLERVLGKDVPTEFFDWRPGDQPVYVSDISKAKEDLGWAPKIDPGQGVDQLAEWVRDNKDLIQDQLGGLLK
jgi:CDP-paratose 2-epimerase